MAWVKLDDQFADHPKVLSVGPLAGWLHICALCYCGRYLTDGFIPAAQVRKLADLDNPGALVGKLLDAGMWEAANGGYRIHDYLEYNPSRQKVLEERRQKAERQERWRKTKEERDALQDALQDGLETPAPSPSPSPSPSLDSLSHAHAREKIDPAEHMLTAGAEMQAGVADPTEDAERWMQYRDNALKAYQQATGLKLAPANRDLIVTLAGEADFNWVQWQQSITSCIAGGVKPSNVGCMVDTYRDGGDYKAMLNKRNNGQHGRPPPGPPGDDWARRLKDDLAAGKVVAGTVDFLEG